MDSLVLKWRPCRVHWALWIVVGWSESRWVFLNSTPINLRVLARYRQVVTGRTRPVFRCAPLFTKGVLTPVTGFALAWKITLKQGLLGQFLIGIGQGFGQHLVDAAPFHAGDTEAITGQAQFFAYLGNVLQLLQD